MSKGRPDLDPSIGAPAPAIIHNPTLRERFFNGRLGRVVAVVGGIAIVGALAGGVMKTSGDRNIAVGQGGDTELTTGTMQGTTEVGTTTAPATTEAGTTTGVDPADVLSAPGSVNKKNTKNRISQEALAKILSVETTTFNCTKDVDNTAEVVTLADGSKIVRPEVGARPGKGLWGDSISTPMKHTENRKAAEREIKTALCEDPVVASMVARHFAEMEIDGHKIINMNPWLKPYAGNPSGINDDAERLMPGYGKELKGDKAVEEALEAKREHEALAEKLATLLDRYKNLGFKGNVTTTLNYHLKAGGHKVEGMPEVELNEDQYKGRFLVFELTDKDGDCLRVLMFNTGDKRLAESGVCEVLNPPAKPHTPARPVNPTGPRTTITTVTPPPRPRNPRTPVKPQGGKDHTQSPVTPDRNNPDQDRRPNIPTPTVAIQPSGAPNVDPHVEVAPVTGNPSRPDVVPDPRPEGQQQGTTTPASDGTKNDAPVVGEVATP